MTEMLKIGFVGTGIMGKSMLCNLGKRAMRCMPMLGTLRRLRTLNPKGLPFMKRLLTASKRSMS